MSVQRRLPRSVLPVFASALLGSALAVAINLATEWKYSVLAWVAVAVLTALTALVALVSTREPPGTARPNRLRFGNRLRSRRLRLHGQGTVVDVGDDATIDDIDISSGPSR